MAWDGAPVGRGSDNDGADLRDGGSVGGVVWAAGFAREFRTLVRQYRRQVFRDSAGAPVGASHRRGGDGLVPLRLPVGGAAGAGSEKGEKDQDQEQDFFHILLHK